MHNFSRIRTVPFACMLLSIMLALPTIIHAQTGPTFTPTQTTNNFPDAITFTTHVTSPGPELVKAEFLYAVDRHLALDNITRVKLDITPGTKLALTYTWDTSKTTITPWTPVRIQWRVADAAGNWYASEPEWVYYADTRFQWQHLENDDLVVLWHDKPADFGEKVFEIAQEALQRQRQLFGVDLDIPVRLIIYNNLNEFNAWHSLALDWIGGEAFPELGITTQIVTTSTPDNYWLQVVVPHEISHLYLYQAAYNPRAPVPVWLNEGIAQYNEFLEDPEAQALVAKAVRENKLIPLTLLDDGFGKHDEERIALGYAESLSAVTYLVETYGEKGLARLLAAYKAGLPTNKAFPEALGVDMGTFQQDWAAWLGAPRESMNTPTPWPLATYPPIPTPRTSSGPVSPTPKAPSTATPPRPPLTPTPTPEPTPTVPASDTQRSPLPCVGILWLFPAPLFAAFWLSRSRR